jgi:hypothetical protein
MRIMVLLVSTVLLCLCCGCGNVASHADASPPLPDAVAGSRCDPSQPFLNATLVPNVNSAGDDGTPRLSADELEMFFFSDRPGGAGVQDIYVAKRASRDDDFGTPMPIRELNTIGAEGGAFLASDNLTLYYHAGLSMLVAARPSRTAPFGTPATVDNIDGPQDDAEPYLTQNDQVIYFPSNRVTVGNYDIYRSIRDSSGTFGMPKPVTEINMTSAGESNPVVSTDGLTIYWGTNVADTSDIWVATRPSTSAAFAAPMRHGTLNTQSFDAPGWISADNCMIYIWSNRPNGIGRMDIWVAKRPL